MLKLKMFSKHHFWTIIKLVKFPPLLDWDMQSYIIVIIYLLYGLLPSLFIVEVFFI